MNKKQRILALVFLSVCCWLFMQIAQAQIRKHPRVIELEGTMREEASRVIRARFPNLPIIVQVSLDPLRRDGIVSRDTKATEDLPVMGPTTIEIQDEWDDPARSQEELLQRIRSANVNITLPESASETEIIELREALFATLNLIQGRDRIEFQRRAWAQGNKKDESSNTPYFVIGGLLMLALLCLWGISWSASRNLSKAFTKSGGGDSQITPMPAPAPVMNAHSSSMSSHQTPTSLSGDVSFNDPLRIRDALKDVVTKLEQSKGFPDLEDVIAMDLKIATNQGAMGIFFDEMPVNMRNKLFSYGTGKHWLEAFSEPGHLDMNTFEFVSRLSTRQRGNTNETWQETLIAVWRLKELLPDFMRSISRDEALAILAHMPPAYSVPVAKSSFPGGWGQLLDANFRPTPLSPDKAKMIRDRALSLRPWADIETLKHFKHERSLLDFLRVAEVGDERDIYETVHNQSMIHSIRPPFYALFNLDAKVVGKLLVRLPMEDLAMALFNVSRNDRRTIESAMNPKQRFMLIEHLKRLDQNPPDKQRIGHIREAIGKEVLHLQRILEIASTAPQENMDVPAQDEESTDEQTAA